MDYEKKYRDLVEAVKELQEANLSDEGIQNWVNDNVPELKESEDERIRKEILDCFRAMKQQGCFPSKHKEQYDSWIAWLEKQGESKSYSWKPTKEQFEALDYAYNSCSDTERGNYYEGVLESLIEDLHRFEKQGEHANFLNKIQIGDKVTRNQDGVLVNLSQLNRVAKPTEKVELKFKVGDWIYHEISGNTLHINKIEYGLYISDEGATISLSRQNDWRLWTIADAKDGDVLAFYSEYRGNKMVQVEIIEKYVGKLGGCSYTFKIYVGVNWDNNFQIGEYMGCSDIRPATKEQCDTLMKAMADAGYTFDFEKKELKNIEQKPWSEEDEEIIDALISFCNAAKEAHPKISVGALVDWLSALKDRVQPQPRQEWSEEDKEVINLLLELIYEQDKLSPRIPSNEKRKRMLYWLKSLRPQNTWKPSEEDEELKSASISYLCNLRDSFESRKWDKEPIQKCINWLSQMK